MRKKDLERRKPEILGTEIKVKQFILNNMGRVYLTEVVVC